MAVKGSAQERRLSQIELMGHLFRRAGFGATRDALEAAWVWRMIHTQRSLGERMVLLWHCLFATGNAKVESPLQMATQIETFRRMALSDFRSILLELSKDPAMLFWLDNQLNTEDAPNENYGRELLELFPIGIGTHSEDDVKDCARAFTGWTFEEAVPGVKPYGRFRWACEFRPGQHDGGNKSFLGESGAFDGTDIIDITVRQPAAGQFLAKRLYLFFVADHPDPEAIDHLASVYHGSRYDIRAVLQALFLRPSSARNGPITPRSRALPSTWSASCDSSAITRRHSRGLAISHWSAVTWGRTS